MPSSVPPYRPSKMAWSQKVVWSSMALLSSGVALFSYRYLFGHASAPDIIATNGHFDPWIVVHATVASTALLLGPLQFIPADTTPTLGLAAPYDGSLLCGCVWNWRTIGAGSCNRCIIRCDRRTWFRRAGRRVAGHDRRRAASDSFRSCRLAPTLDDPIFRTNPRRRHVAHLPASVRRAWVRFSRFLSRNRMAVLGAEPCGRGMVSSQTPSRLTVQDPALSERAPGSDQRSVAMIADRMPISATRSVRRNSFDS